MQFRHIKKASGRYNSMNAPQALCYPIKSLLVPRSNSGGPVSEWMEFTLQPENTL